MIAAINIFLLTGFVANVSFIGIEKSEVTFTVFFAVNPALKTENLFVPYNTLSVGVHPAKTV